MAASTPARPRRSAAHRAPDRAPSLHTARAAPRSTRASAWAATLLLAATVAALGTAAPLAPLAAQSSAPNAADEIVLNPGDSVRITVWRKPELTGEFVVSANGVISHPLYRSVQVAGVPLARVEASVRELLQTYETNPQFVVEPLIRVAVGGEVRLPNLYAVTPGTTVAQAIAIAGGALERARLEAVHVRRGDSEFNADLRRSDPSSARMTVRSGDQIIVDRGSDFFHEVLTPVATILGASAAVVAAVRSGHH